MEKFDLDEIGAQLRSLSTTEKLNYWQEIIERFLFIPLKHIPFDSLEAVEALYVKLFGIGYRLMAPLQIPFHIYKEHFMERENDPEYIYWFLKYEAQFELERLMKNEKVEKNLRLTDDTKSKWINGRLKKIEDFENQSRELLSNGMINIYTDLNNNTYRKEIECLRVLEDYYNSEVLDEKNRKSNFTAKLYAEHIFLQEYLKMELKKFGNGNDHVKKRRKPELTLREIGLKYFYENLTITRKNGDEIAKEYGHTSGEKLFQHYTHYSSRTNRTGKPFPFTNNKLSFKIKLFEKVITLLPPSMQEPAIDELKIIRDYLLEL